MEGSHLFYHIGETLSPIPPERLKDAPPYVAVLRADQWPLYWDRFDMVIDMDLDTASPRETKAVVNADSLTGSFSVPDRSRVTDLRHCFSFALDEKGVVWIDDTGYAQSLVDSIQRTKKWRLPSLERFLYDFLEKIIEGDLSLLEAYEHRLNAIEDAVLKSGMDDLPPELNDIRGDLLDLRVHYEQLIDLGQELEENENGFFDPDNLRYFRLFTERVMRLKDMVTSLRDYTIQLRDLIHTRLEARQNKIMTLLTVITSIFMPLSLIAGWYGMNFTHMPELSWPGSYPVVILVSIAIVVVCLIWFKRKKWL